MKKLVNYCSIILLLLLATSQVKAQSVDVVIRENGTERKESIVCSNVFLLRNRGKALSAEVSLLLVCLLYTSSPGLFDEFRDVPVVFGFLNHALRFRIPLFGDYLIIHRKVVSLR